MIIPEVVRDALARQAPVETCLRPGCAGTMVEREARARMGWRDMRVRLITVCGRCGHPPVAPGVEEDGA